MNYLNCFLTFSFILLSALCITDAQTAKPAGNEIILPKDSPAMVYKHLYNAVQRKDTAAIRSLMSKESVHFAEFAAKQQKKTADEILMNGFIEGNLSPTFPKIRNQRIKGNFAALQVENTDAESKTIEFLKWIDVPFILEDRKWKIAVGDMFNGNYKLPCEISTKLNFQVYKTTTPNNSSKKRLRNKKLKRETNQSVLPPLPYSGNFCKPSDITQPNIKGN